MPHYNISSSEALANYDAEVEANYYEYWIQHDQLPLDGAFENDAMMMTEPAELQLETWDDSLEDVAVSQWLNLN
ncbi:hypothetical protein GOP47_0010574 [Adiantum capillus-veneris]|uniref:Uncharacterized protein n=1 Tax=Adiantum capillus-veneris TaxID=13818 RepID=A0A9D4UW40_ADICA|nr:hypothetical protein GOP47_0031051 [Adiantum capillus-veneris]KAI5054058.1 hypothetical protein GOP47_0031054 [Adiantum capillus-veneris]KAI5074613.1 hypothetical protein GOP47_0010574 [Adiantum capillus-veneris]